MARAHWGNCVTHFDRDVGPFVAKYFGAPDRRALLVAGAGFDPRTALVTEQLAGAMGDRLQAIFLREERGDPAANLRQRANDNESRLRALVPLSEVRKIDIFADDGAPVGGARLGELLGPLTLPPGTTDVVFDMSAVSLGISFPTVRLLLEKCETLTDVSFHVFIASNPDLDARIIGEPGDRAMNIRGFAGMTALGDDRVARIWIPHLASGGARVLGKIQAATEDIYKVCPVLPFPARNPRRADELITEFGAQLRDEWQVDARDLIYVSERNPLDSYRTISTLKVRYDRTVRGVYVPQLVLSPIGSKVMAFGALMAAIEHDLGVHYVETVRYDWSGDAAPPQEPDAIVHVWLHGPIYSGY